MGEFSVGNYREYQLRDDLANLIDKYNKKFQGESASKKQSHHSKPDIKESKYSDKMITNPSAIPDPSAAEGNYSWMYLMTPHYNQLVKEFDEKTLENSVLKQHCEYYMHI